jgi:hypothetical protein
MPDVLSPEQTEQKLWIPGNEVATEGCVLERVLSEAESDSIKKGLFGAVGRDEPKSKRIGVPGDCPYVSCPFFFSWANSGYCDNPEVIERCAGENQEVQYAHP